MAKNNGYIDELLILPLQPEELIKLSQENFELYIPFWDAISAQIKLSPFDGDIEKVESDIEVSNAYFEWAEHIRQKVRPDFKSEFDAADGIIAQLDESRSKVFGNLVWGIINIFSGFPGKHMIGYKIGSYPTVNSPNINERKETLLNILDEYQNITRFKRSAPLNMKKYGSDLSGEISIDNRVMQVLEMLPDQYFHRAVYFSPLLFKTELRERNDPNFNGAFRQFYSELRETYSGQIVDESSFLEE